MKIVALIAEFAALVGIMFILRGYYGMNSEQWQFYATFILVGVFGAASSYLGHAQSATSKEEK